MVRFCCSIQGRPEVVADAPDGSDAEILAGDPLAPCPQLVAGQLIYGGVCNLVLQDVPIELTMPA